MSPYGEDSTTVHNFLMFALSMAITKEHVENFYNDNAHVILQLAENHKRYILSEYNRRLNGEPIKEEPKMAYEHKDRKGGMFKNPKKQQGDNQPNAKGSAMIDGRVLNISAWTRVNKEGVPFQALEIGWADEAKNYQKPAQPLNEQLNDSIPWD